MGWNHDPDAVHAHKSGEINALTEKTTPHDDDLLLIEDSEASNVKKKVKLSNLGGGAETLDDLTDVDLTTPPTDGQVLKYDNSSDSWIPADDDVGSGSLPTASAKGDLAVYDGDSWEILTASTTDGHVLTIDTGESLGMEWAEPSGGGGGGFAQYGNLVTPPASGWSWFNQGSATITVESAGTHVLNTPAVGANNLVGRVRSHTSGDIHTALLAGQANNAHGGFGLCFQSASGQLVVAYIKRSGTALTIENWNSPTSFSSGPSTPGAFPGPLQWLQVEDNGSNLIFRTGAVGFSTGFISVTSLGRTAFLTGGPTAVGFFVRDNGTAAVAALLSWETT